MAKVNVCMLRFLDDDDDVKRVRDKLNIRMPSGRRFKMFISVGPD